MIFKNYFFWIIHWNYSKTGVDTIELTHLLPSPGKFLETERAIREGKEMLFINYSSIDVSDLWKYPLDVESKELVHAAIDHSISLHPYLSEAYTFYLQNDLYFVKAAEASSAVLV